MGSPEFAVPALERLLAQHDVVLVVTQPDKPAGRGKKLTPPPVKRVAQQAGVDVYQPTSARAPEFVDRLRAAAPDVCVVVAYGKILPRPVLDVAPLGCVNIHASLLPKYRGAAPIQWAILRGETVTGVTIMQLDEGMDTGPILLTREVPIAPDDTAGSLHDKLAPIGADLLVEALDGLAAGTIEPRPQDDASATYAPMLTKADGQVDWRRSAREVRDRVRGVDPWPGAFTLVDGAPLKLYGARLASGAGAPGEVLAAEGDGLRVACGDGAVTIAEVQAPGRRRMPAAAFATGRRLTPGMVLGT
ncbi:MAG: methionyl-tRNA formyltransferase [Deltaproteobacteria bacterium]|nr:MAG: methionyl-tRNA formyltransferase [Deltaproteobacteria bacterium]